MKECAKAHLDNRIKLWSFEVKKLINRSNLREAFFQTVSNSSWANFGYLVAGEIEGQSTMEELQLLTNLHGMGIMLLNVDDPNESQILIPAKERSTVDWGTANRLHQENTDFKQFITGVRRSCDNGGIGDKKPFA